VTPVPLDLPLRPAEAAELANLIFEHAERKPLSDDLRNRLAGRAAALKLQTIRPWFGSLARDPVHPSAYYLAVDGQDSAQLLYIALATAPTSSIYHKPLLISRVRRLNGPEMVINAIPFSAADRANVETFAARIDSAFYPQPQGARSTITVAEDYPAAFGAFRSIQKRTGRNNAAVAGDYHAALWAAIRAGWRSGYTVSGCVCHAIPEEGYSRYRLTVSPTDDGLKRAEEIHEQIRRARVAVKISRGFDFELAFDTAIGADALRSALQRLSEGAHMPQLVEAVTSDPETTIEIARQFQVTLSIAYTGKTISAGRVNYNVRSAEEAESIAESLS
jgi:hypothetical protein